MKNQPIILYSALAGFLITFGLLYAGTMANYNKPLNTNLQSAPELGITGSYSRLDPITFQSYFVNPDQTPETADNSSLVALLNANTITNTTFTSNLQSIQQTISNTVRGLEPTAKVSRIAPDSLKTAGNSVSFVIIVDTPVYHEFNVSVTPNGQTAVSRKL